MKPELVVVPDPPVREYSADLVRQRVGVQLLRILDEVDAAIAEGRIAVNNPADFRRVMGAMNDAVKLVQGAELLEIARELPSDPVEQRKMLAEFRQIIEGRKQAS